MGTYTQNLVREWSREHEVWSLESRGGFQGVGFTGRIRISSWNPGWRRQIEARTDVVHCPRQVVPEPLYTLDKPLVVTIHGAGQFALSGTGLARPVGEFNRRLRERQDQVSVFLTVSESAGQEIEKHYGIPAERIKTIYHGVDTELFSPPADKAAARLRACARFGIPERYLLHVSNYRPKKNAARIVTAYRRLRAMGFRDLALVLAGGVYFGFEEVAAEINREASGTVVRLGKLQGSELALLYQGAEVFLFPSLHESFGLPALESMACGVPVVVSNVYSLPEVTGGAAVQVNPESVEEIADGVARLLRDERFYAECQQAGLARSRLFQWSLCAQKHVEAFERVVERRRLRQMIPELNRGPYEARSYWDQRAELFEVDPYLSVCSLHKSRDDNEQVHALQRQRLLPLVTSFLSGPEPRVLEVGCGVGRWAKALGAADVRYTGVDLSHKMLARARRENRGSLFVQSAARALPFAAESFDFTLTVTVLHHIPYGEQEAAVQELVRVTQPGGHVVTLEDIRQPANPHHMFSHPPEGWVALFAQAGCRLVQSLPLCYPGEKENRAVIFVYAKTPRPARPD